MAKKKKAAAATPEAKELFELLREDLLAKPELDLEYLEMSRDQMAEHPTIVFPLLEYADANELRLEQRGAVSSLALDVLASQPDNEAIEETGTTLVLDFLLRASAEPASIEAGGFLHLHLSEALALCKDGDLDRSEAYQGDLEKTLEALAEFVKEATAEE
jgi:hypothetical protein